MEKLILASALGAAIGYTLASKRRRAAVRALPTEPPPGFYGLSGQLVIVTGGASGIGRAIVEAFALHGAYVCFADRDAAAAAALLDECDCAETRKRLLFVEANFADARAPAAIVGAAQAWRLGAAVDVLCNNVGMQQNNTPVHLLEEADWDRCLDINLKSYFLMSKHCLPSMLAQQRGVIINTASVQALASQVGIPAYASSKGAICSLTRQMALDYSSHGVRVLAVSPGTIRTAHLEADLIAQGQSCEGLGSRYPLGRMGEPSDVAELCVYLASERARNMTGANVCCDGGIAAMGCWDQRVGTRSYLSERR